MTIRRKMKWKYTYRTINGRRRKVKTHRKRVLDGYLVRVVKKKGRHPRGYKRLSGFRRVFGQTTL